MIDNKEYRLKDLNNVQKEIAEKINITNKKLNELKDAYETFQILSDYKHIMCQSFNATLNHDKKDNSK